MLNVVILGTGNLAKHVFGAFSKSGKVQVVQLVGRNQESLKDFATQTTTSDDFYSILDADVYVIAVKDDAIAEVSSYLKDKKGIVVHTSGVVEMSAIEPENRGVFYPLQTFTKGKAVDFSTIPICIEADAPQSLETLRILAETISEKVHEIDSEQRKKLHLAAVFVNNFTNYLYGVGEEICLEEGLPFDLLQPLIMETAEKVQTLSPKEAQTGPARRNDEKSMASHLELLKNEKHIAIYKLLSEAIKQAYEKEL
ncbi:Rossmann-like and DUF2520 domain-containing protein [Flagellimonas zhangzhouensis]|uniref:NADP oxidoreductase coenzyme F420-dependent n=1 Tax=Flagellimonas zhangzhouensis TaxID=1073328 RepID=A0A1H2SW98_9FLAO|nr:Rossmann-like and DUF2520 domain-containing protein [Allomuricauda zhangzhouensis]SDQ80335.1 NADP oxidoreductase coenzyme F420-dependent [Allomuricauda zhangzhouensis]SDW35870.1 NADP oxidoreductase coenzyme F420-dependent [Allomuricauda zhangzhouensis]